MRSRLYRQSLLFIVIGILISLMPAHTRSTPAVHAADPVPTLPPVPTLTPIDPGELQPVDLDDHQPLISGQARTFAINPQADEDTLYVDANKGQEITVSMKRLSSDGALNGYLSLRAPDGMTIARDDNTGGQGNPVIDRALAPVTGRYTILVTDESGTRTGDYEIIAVVQDPLLPEPTVGAMELEADPCPVVPPPTNTSAQTTSPHQPAPTVGPANPRFDRAAQALLRTTYPVNCTFARGRTVLPTVISPATVTLSGVNAAAQTASFSVPADAQTLRFEYQTGERTTSAGNTLYVTVLSGANFDVRTALTSASITGTRLDDWKPGVLDIRAFQGQAIKLEFKNSDWVDPFSEIRNLVLAVEVPDWHASNATKAWVEATDAGGHVILEGSEQSLTSPAFTVPAAAQSLHFDYWAEERTQGNPYGIEVSVLHGSTFATVTPHEPVFGSSADGWREGVINLDAYRGQTIKIQVKNPWTWNGIVRSHLDAFTLHTDLPDWTASHPAKVTIRSESSIGETRELTNTTFALGSQPLPIELPNADFGLPTVVHTTSIVPNALTLTGANATQTTDAVVVPAAAQVLAFQYQVGESGNWDALNGVFVTVLSGPTFNIRTGIDEQRVRGRLNDGWKDATLDLRRFQGQTIKLEFRNPDWQAPRSDVQNLHFQTHIPTWTLSNGANASMVNADATHPTALELRGANQTATSDVWSIPSNAQTLGFQYHLSESNEPNTLKYLGVVVLSGENFQQATSISGGQVSGTSAAGWKEAVLDIQRFQGQAIKLRFVNPDWYAPVSRIDSITVGTGVPGWTPSNAGLTHVQDTQTSRGTAAVMTGINLSLISDTFVVPTDTVSLEFDYKAGSLADVNARRPIWVQILSGDEAEIVTPIDGNTVGGRLSDPAGGWHQASLNLTAFQGRAIQLRFVTDASEASQVWIDTVALVAGTARAAHGPDHAPDGDFLELRGNNTTVTSAAFAVPTTATTLRFEYQTGYLDSGSAKNTISVEVLSGATFSTVTLLSNGNPTLSQSLHDGWQVARLNLSQFQGQTIKLRFANPWSGVPRTRLDKVAILTPRAQLSSPVTITGTTYLDTPLTGFGGPTTTAFITITTMTVYDEYVDMGGQIAYDHRNYPFEMTGDLYRTMQGSPNDKIGRFQSLTGFNVVHFETRLHSLLDETGPSFTSITLQRTHTREITDFVISEEDSLLSVIQPLLSANGNYTTAIQDEYHVFSVESPISMIENNNHETMDIIKDKMYRISLKYRTYIHFGTKKRPHGMCTVEDSFKVYILWEVDGDIRGSNGYSDISSQQRIFNARTYIVDDPKNDPGCAQIDPILNTVFWVESPGTLYTAPGSQSGNLYNVEFFSQALYWISSTVNKNPQIYVNVGIPFFTLVTLNIAGSLFPENTVTLKEQNKLFKFDHYDNSEKEKNPAYEPNIDKYRTRVARFNFSGDDTIIMDTENQIFYSLVRVKYWRGDFNHMNYVEVSTGGSVYRHGLGINDPIDTNLWENTVIPIEDYSYRNYMWYSVSN